MTTYRSEEEHSFIGFSRLLDSIERQVDNHCRVKDRAIRAELLRVNLTKRQRSILWLVCTLSLTLGNEYAYIPKLQDFEICGVSKTKIRNELRKMVDMKLLDWVEEENKFAINSPVEWNAPFNDGYNDRRSAEIFLLNLKMNKNLDLGMLEQESVSINDIKRFVSGG